MNKINIIYNKSNNKFIKMGIHKIVLFNKMTMQINISFNNHNYHTKYNKFNHYSLKI